MGFSEKYIDHFSNPRGVGEVQSADLMSETAHEGGGCFDKVKLTIKTSGGKIIEAKFRSRACSGTIAACSALIEIILNKSMAEARAVTAQTLIDYLGGIPEKKQHSVDLAAQALSLALDSETSGRVN